MDNDLDAQLRKITNGLNMLLDMQAKNEERFRNTDAKFKTIAKNFAKTHDSIRRLERIAVAHEARLARQERRRKKK